MTLAYWPDIWLNEGFATFSEWIYAERHGGPTAQSQFDELYAIPADDPAFEDLWFPAPAALPGPEALFHTPVYDRGAMALQALRAKIGTDGSVVNTQLADPADRIDPAFTQAAIAAVNQWEFTPTRLGGVPIETDMQVTVNFVVR